MKVRAQTNLVKRGNVYTFRKKIPADLREHYGGRESIRKSLGQGITQAEAKRLAGQLAQEHEKAFERLRLELASPPRKLTQELVPELSAALYAHILQADDEQRTDGLTDEAFDALVMDTDQELSVQRAAFARGNAAPVRAQLGDWLSGKRIDADLSSPEGRLLVREFHKAAVRAREAIRQRNEGEIVDTPAAPSLESPVGHVGTRAVRLANVVEYWKGQGDKSHRSKVAADTLVREFVGLHGDVAVRELTKGHFVALRDAMLQRVAPATVQARFNLLKAAFKTCMEDDQFGIQANPLEGVRIRNTEPAERSRDVFSVDQLQVLLDSPVFTQGDRPEGGKQEAAFWAPLISLFTGARLDEVLCLRTDGIYQHEGLWVLHFRHRPALGQRLKGKAKNNRRVPLHPELIRLGLVGYWQEVAKLGAWLFPAIDRSEKARSHSSAWGAWFGRYLDRIGITDDKVTFHSFRHTFKHHARACLIPEDQHDAMTGHQSAEVARRYGSCEGYPIGALQDAMGRLRFGALNLSRVRAAT